MSVEGIRGVVQAAIQRASDATGVDFGFLLGTAKRESGYNPRAQAPTSSAAGLFQFVEQTWLATLKKHGAKYGYARYAEQITRGSDGRYRVAPDARETVMNLRFDAHAASLMAGELTSDHAAYLRGRVGRQPTSGELYAAHFLGPQGSAQLIQAMQTSPGASAAGLFPAAARSNRSIFYREGRPATVAEVYANLTRTGGGAPAVTAPRPEPVDDSAFIKYASARRGAADATQEAVVQMLLRGPVGADGGSGGAGLAGSLFSSEMLRVLAEERSGDGLRR